MSNLKKIQEYLLYLFVFLLPWQTRWIIREAQISSGVFEYGRISIYAFDVVFVLILLNCLIVKLLNNHLEPTTVGSPLLRKEGMPSLSSPFEGEVVRSRRTRGVVVFCFLLIVFCILNILTSSDKLLSTYWYLRIAEGLLLIWLIKKIDFSKTKTALAFVLSMTISAALGIYQFITQNVFASKWLGMASQHPGDLGVSVVETTGGRFLRAYGNLPHPNVLAGFIVVAIVLCFWIIIINKNQLTINKINYKIFNYQLPIVGALLIANCLLLTAGLFFTFSRAAWLMLFLVVIVILTTRQRGEKEGSRRCHPERSDGIFTKDSIGPIAIRPRNDVRKKPLFIFHYSLFIILIFCCLSFIYWPLIQTRTSTTSRLELKSNTERLTGYSQAWQIIKQNPLLGVGLGNYTIALQKNNPGQPAWFYQPVHNIYLLALAELGIILIITLISLFLYFLIKNKSEIRDQKLGLILYSCVFIFLFFDHFWWTLPSAFLPLFFLPILIKKNNSE
ncbi:MAG: O-antigen ligase family protein [Patescibacteria group bacterium]|nr:O-antigen ligase family protein [Patescibacteria group bacterium]